MTAMTVRARAGILGVLFGLSTLMTLEAAAADGRWTSTGAMTVPRANHSATLLTDGRVLVTGGGGGAEVYSPTTGTWSTTAPMILERADHTATRMADGRVLVAGGQALVAGENSYSAQAAAEVFNRVSGTWSAVSAMLTNRLWHAAALLADGRVLVAGGVDNELRKLKSAEIFNPTTGSWSSAGKMDSARASFTVTLLGDGRVLAVGGDGPSNFGSYDPTYELFNPITGTWTASPMNTKRAGHSALLLASGKVLVVGGTLLSNPGEIYNPSTGTWQAVAAMNTLRDRVATALLADGRVLVTGGLASKAPYYLATAEVFSPTAGIWSLAGEMSTSRMYHTATLLNDGRVLVAGGQPRSTKLSSAELYAPAGSALTGALRVSLAPATAVTAGAKWRVDGGSFVGSQTVLTNLAVGNHTVSFKPIAGWTTPPDQSVAVTANTTTTATATYAPCDTTKPTLTIVTPTAGLRATNSLFTATGTAKDNAAVTAVLCQFNAGSWKSATSVDNWATWKVPNLALSPGTNTLRVYAVDAAGNRSSTNTVAWFFPLSQMLTVQLIGSGTLSPNYSNAVLEIGKSYTLTVTPGAGFTFSNWMGGVPPSAAMLTNKPSLRFVMTSNLVVQAVLGDVQKPVLAVTNLKAGARLSNETVVVRGNVTDNSGLRGVFCRLNNGQWQAALGTNTWEATTPLRPGTNRFEAYAMDQAGNRSATNALDLFRVVLAPLSVRVWGKGTLSPNYGGQQLELGRGYTMTASPGIGFAFTNWVLGTNWTRWLEFSQSKLNFVMQSNLTLEANFAFPKHPVVKVRSLDLGDAGNYDLYLVSKGSDNPFSTTAGAISPAALSKAAYLFLAPAATGVPVSRNDALFSGLTGSLAQFVVPPRASAQFARLRYDKGGDVFYAATGELPGVLETAFLVGYNRADRRELYCRFLLEAIAFKGTPVDQAYTVAKAGAGGTNAVYVERLHPRVVQEVCMDVAKLLKIIGTNAALGVVSSAWSGAVDLGHFDDEFELAAWLVELPRNEPMGTDLYLRTFQVLSRVKNWASPEFVKGLSSVTRWGEFATYLVREVSDAHEQALVESVLRSYLNTSAEAKSRVALIRQAYQYALTNYESALDPALGDALAQLETTVTEQDSELKQTLVNFLKAESRGSGLTELLSRLDAVSKGKVVSLAGKFGQRLISSFNKNAGSAFFDKFTSWTGKGGSDFINAMVTSLSLLNQELSFYKEHASLLTLFEVIRRYEVQELMWDLEASRNPVMRVEAYDSYRTSQMLKLYFANRICERVLDEKVTFGTVNWAQSGIDATVGLLKAPATHGFSAVGPFVKLGDSLIKSLASTHFDEEWKQLEVDRRTFRTNLVDYYYASDTNQAFVESLYMPSATYTPSITPRAPAHQQSLVRALADSTTPANPEPTLSAKLHCANGPTDKQDASDGYASPGANAQTIGEATDEPRARLHSLRLEVPTWSTNGSLIVRLHGQEGGRYHILSSVDLANWTIIATVTNTTGISELRESVLPGTGRYYRARSAD